MKVIKGDCLRVLKMCEDASISCIITSPPYNLGKQYLNYKDDLSTIAYLDFMEEVSASFKRILKDDGHIFLNVGYTNKDPWLAFDVASRFRKIFILQNSIIWLKHVKIGLDTFGIYKPIASKRYTSPVFENIFHFTHQGDCCVNRESISGTYGPRKGPYAECYTLKGSRIRYECTLKRKVCKQLFGHTNWKSLQQKDPIFLKALEEERLRKPFTFQAPKDEGNVWYIPYTPVAKLAKELGVDVLGTNKTAKGNHPAVFPVDFPRNCLLFADYKKHWTVLDPFVGTGSTLVACKQLGIKNGIGIDLSQEYVDFAQKRLALTVESS